MTSVVTNASTNLRMETMTMNRSISIAMQLRRAKLEYEVAQYEADEKKKIYERLRHELVNEMVIDSLPKFELDGDDQIPKLSFRLETKERYSPVVENKDLLMSKLKEDAPELFSVSAAALQSYISDIVANNDGTLPEEYTNLIKKYDDTHVVVRTVKK